MAIYFAFHGSVPQGQQVGKHSDRIGCQAVLTRDTCRPYQGDHSARRRYPRQLAATIPPVLMPSCSELVGVDRTTTTRHDRSKTG